jgi:heat shock protein HspQ
MATPPRKRVTPPAPPVASHDAPAPVAATKAMGAKAAGGKVAPTKRIASTASKPVATPIAASGTPGPKVTAAVAPTKPKVRKGAAKAPASPTGMRQAKFSVGAVVKHRVYPFRGVVFDIDPVFNNTEDWWQAIPEEIRPRKDQPFYHLLAENAETTYVAYVSEQNLLADKTGQPVRHPQVKEMFALDGNGQYRARFLQSH